MPRKIIIVRHGETDYNKERRLQGWADIPLNQSGHEQAQKVAIRLKGENPSAIYSSDHQRAFMTALHIGKALNLVPIPTPALREDHLGIFQHWQWEVEKDLVKEKLWIERHEARAKRNLFYRESGTESLHHHLARVKNFLYELEQNHPDHTVIIVSHGGTINRIMEIFNFVDPSEGYVGYKNTSVSVIEKVGEGYTLTLNNDISHLDGY